MQPRIQPSMRSCYRFRNTSVLNFSPFTSLAECNSATVQVTTAGSSRIDASSSSSSNNRANGTGGLCPKYDFPLLITKLDHSHTRKKAFRHKDSRGSGSSRESDASPSTVGDCPFEPLATSTECSRSHRPESFLFESEPPSGASLSSNICGESSPPPYSSRQSFALNTQTSPNSPQVVWDHEALKDYSNMDLENESLSSRYTQCIELPLEDYYRGKRVMYGFTRKSSKGKSCRKTLAVVIPPGCQSHTVFCFSNAGHQIEDGSLQDIHLIFVDRPHSLLYRRSGANLGTRVSLPWSDHLKEGPLRFSVCNIDGKKYSLEVDYRNNKMMAGSAIFMDAGMPREDGKGRGTLRIEWEIAVAASNDASP